MRATFAGQSDAPTSDTSWHFWNWRVFRVEDCAGT